MWVKKYSKIFQNVKRKTIWKIWTDINNWSTWHSDIEYCKFEGKFEVGKYFFLKPRGNKPVKMLLIDIKEGYSFTDCIPLFGAKIYDTHTLQETSEGLQISYTLTITGPLKWWWTKILGEKLIDTVPDQTEALIYTAREKEYKEHYV